MQCKDCDRPIRARNKSGYCAVHVHAARAADPAWRARLSASIQRRMAHDPEFLQKKREQARRLSASPEIVAKRTAHFDQRIRDLGHQTALDPEVRARAGRSITAARLSWCPTHLRPDYLDLINLSHIPAAEARAMIEEQNELDMARWRRSIGETTAQVEVEINDLAMILNPIERVLVHAARLFDMEVADITCRNRRRELMIPRYAVALALQRSGVALLRIGQALNRPDHTTARNSAIQGEELAERDPEFAAKVQALQETFAMAPAKIRRAA